MYRCFSRFFVLCQCNAVIFSNRQSVTCDLKFFSCLNARIRIASMRFMCPSVALINQSLLVFGLP